MRLGCFIVFIGARSSMLLVLFMCTVILTVQASLNLGKMFWLLHRRPSRAVPQGTATSSTHAERQRSQTSPLSSLVTRLLVKGQSGAFHVRVSSDGFQTESKD